MLAWTSFIFIYTAYYWNSILKVCVFLNWICEHHWPPFLSSFFIYYDLTMFCTRNRTTVCLPRGSQAVLPLSPWVFSKSCYSSHGILECGAHRCFLTFFSEGCLPRVLQWIQSHNQLKAMSLHSERCPATLPVPGIAPLRSIPDTRQGGAEKCITVSPVLRPASPSTPAPASPHCSMNMPLQVLQVPFSLEDGL